MPGLGTIVNVSAIIAGGLLGLLSKKFLKERFEQTIIKAMGFAIVVMSLASVFSAMLEVSIESPAPDGLTNGTLSETLKGTLCAQGTMMMIVSMALGALFGELINLEHWFEKFGGWLKEKTGSSGDSLFIEAFLTSSFTVCIGAMAIIGSIQDGISGEHKTLFAKAILDFIIILMMTASMGKGCIFSALPVALLQGTITIFAHLIAPVMTDAALNNISLVGNVLILCVGVNLIFPKTIRVANVLPALVFAVAFAYVH